MIDFIHMQRSTMPGTHPAIRLTGLTREFGTLTAVDRLDLEIAPGEFFSMLGPSGSGKTTVLRLIAGFEQPNAGTVELFGEDVTKKAPFDRDVNTVFQDYALFPHMTVRDNVAYGLRVRGVPKAERRARALKALESVRLDHLGDRMPSQLSGGQRQRVALARAIVVEPKALLLDEPLGALDLKLREQMQVELKQIQSEVGITFIYVTHDQDEALTMSDRIAVFNEGRIEQLSSPRDLYEHPANEFVAGFVGVSNAIERDGKKLTIRPEKIRLIGEGDPTDGLVTERGEITESAYVGMVTRVKVELEQGGAVQVALQNTESEAEPGGRVGQKVVVGWRPEHAVSIQQGERTQSVQLEEENVS